MSGDLPKSHYAHHGSSRHFSRHEIKSAKREERVAPRSRLGRSHFWLRQPRPKSRTAKLRGRQVEAGMTFIGLFNYSKYILI